MKNIVLLFFLLISQFSIAQNHKIAQLLNKQLQKEVTHLYTDEERENFIVTEPFRIDENNVLHFGFTMIKNADGEKTNIKREVPLDLVGGFDKDMNVYFHTLGKHVTETRTDYDKNGIILRTKTDKTHLFSTEINKESYPHRFMKQMAKAIAKAGYDIECSY
ncbi:hypothetical protein [Soonwooa purpurea]